MEPLYPQNILERRIPILRELREKAEREADARPYRKAAKSEVKDFEAEEGLYAPRPYEDGPIGKNLNTLA